MKTYLKLAWRNIWRNRRRTLITASAIVFAVMLSVLMQSLNRGSHEVMLANMLRFSTGYMQLQDYRYDDEPSLDNAFAYDQQMRERVLQADDRIANAVPRLETFMLAANDQSSRGAVVFGVEPEKEDRFNQLGNRIVAGRFFRVDESAAVIGEGLAGRLQLEVGDTLALIGQGRFGMSASGLFEIAGLIEHPLQKMNDQVVFLPLPAAQELLSAEDHISALLIAPRQKRQTDAVAASLRTEFADDQLAVLTWPEMLPELLQLFEFDLAAPRMFSVILYIVIGFGFFGTVLTMTMERLREFGVLLSVGMKRGRLAMVVLIETLLISLIGVLTGMGAAWLLIYYLHHHPIVLRGDAAQAVIDMGWNPVLPVSFAADQFYTQALAVLVIALVVFLFPLLKILRLNILDAARS